MIINFGEITHSQILNLCEFMKVRQFPIGFFKDILEDTTFLSFHFTSADRVIVTMNDVQVYSGDFSKSWANYEYQHNFNGLISQLRQDDREIADDLDELTRDLDYLGLFEEYLDEQEADELEEAEEIDMFLDRYNEERRRLSEQYDEKPDEDAE
jgi:hypothetical protein